MIALMILVGIAIWLVVVIALIVWIPRVVGEGWPRTVARLILFPVLLVLPIVDEWIGRMQFKELCEREAVVNLSGEWENVRKAEGPIEEVENLDNYIIPMEIIHQKYIDAGSRKEFLEIKWVFRKWGLFGRLVGLESLGLFSSMSCSPKNRSQVLKMINIDELKRGK